MGILFSGYTEPNWAIGTFHTPGSGRHAGWELCTGAVGAWVQEGSTFQTDALLAAICSLQPVQAKLPGTFILSVGLL